MSAVQTTYLGDPKDDRTFTATSSAAVPLLPPTTVSGTTVLQASAHGSSLMIIDSVPPPQGPQQYGCWEDWRKGNYAFGVVFEAACAELSRLGDGKGRSPLDPNWRVKKLCFGRVRRLLQNLISYIYTGDFRKGRKAWAQWSSIGTKYKKRKYMQGIGILLGVVNNHARAVPVDGLTEWDVEQLDKALALYSPSRTDLDRWVTKWRLEDFTDGRGREVTDPDLPLACMAAFEGGGGWNYAAVMARRWLRENT